MNVFDVDHRVCWGTIPFSGATTKGALLPRVPQALNKKGPSLMLSSLFTPIISPATVSNTVPMTINCFLLATEVHFFVTVDASFIYSFVVLVFILGK